MVVGHSAANPELVAAYLASIDCEVRLADGRQSALVRYGQGTLTNPANGVTSAPGVRPCNQVCGVAEWPHKELDSGLGWTSSVGATTGLETWREISTGTAVPEGFGARNSCGSI